MNAVEFYNMTKYHTKRVAEVLIGVGLIPLAMVFMLVGTAVVKKRFG